MKAKARPSTTIKQALKCHIESMKVFKPYPKAKSGIAMGYKIIQPETKGSLL